MIRIRPGRSWRLNPAYLGELRALSGARAKGYTGAEILDVLGIEVDGVDIAAGVGEARVLLAVEELAQALLRLGQGEPAAQATIGPGPTELVLEARGSDLLLTLVTLAPPARVLAAGLLVDAHKMRAATVHAARGMLLDLLAISPALSDARLARRLGEMTALLARRGEARQRRWPARESQPAALVCNEARKPEKLQIRLPPETTARLRSASEVRLAPLAPHLGQGSVTLLRTGAPGLTWEGPVFLFLRNLLGEAERLIEAWETGEREHTLQFGSHALRWDLTGDEVRAVGWKKPFRLPPLRLAKLSAGAAQLYADEALRAGGDELSADLRDQAQALLRHCTDLESGDLKRAPAAVSAPPAREPLPKRALLSHGRVRKLVYRRAWSAPLPGALRALAPAGGPILLELAGELAALDSGSGETLWRVPASPGAVLRGGELVYAEPGDALVRIDAASGEVRWKRRLRGALHPARLWALAGGVLRALPGEGLARVGDDGALTFRARLPGGEPELVAAAGSVIVAALRSGLLAGVDPADGRVLWRRKLRASALAAAGARVLALSRGWLSCLDPESGKPAWEAPMPYDAHSLLVHDSAAFLLAGDGVLSVGLPDGTARPALHEPWVQVLAAEEDGALIATGAGGAAMRLDGPRRWSLPAHGAEPARAALVQRGIVVVQRAGTELHNAADGVLLATLPAARAAATGSDFSCVLLGEREVSLHRLATHLSLL
ncbi:MAG TPA: PQQ-binding-like beta-propeller repeat protein [Myxococcales bacterium]|nr:PQQ-binding-like beta-propeller repeat protein [Myxococcales bacterium]